MTMTLEDKLNDFIEKKEEHAFLLYGPWGVGKTYSLNKWIDDNIKDSYKVINLSLFGISSVNDLNALALNSESLRNRFISSLKGIGQDVSVGVGPVSVSLPLIGIVSALLKEKHNKKEKYLFVLDDIERKDNKLTVEEILGFVETLPKENSKVILVANLNKLEDSNAFKGFKEKVIQEEFCLELPTKIAVEKIIGVEYANHFISNQYPIKNLRTLIKIKKMIEKLDNNIDLNLLDCIYYCCLNIFENQLNKDELITNYEKDKLSFLETYSALSNNVSDDEKTSEIKKIHDYVDKLKYDWEFVYENIKIKGLLNNLIENNLKIFVKEVFESIKEENYDNLDNIVIPLRSTPLNVYKEHGDSVFLSGKPNEEYERIMYNFLECFSSNDYEMLGLFRNYAVTVINCQKMVSINSKGKRIENQINKLCVKKIAQYIFDNSYFDGDDDLNSPFIARKLPDWLLQLESQILEEYYTIFNTYYVGFSKISRVEWQEINHQLSASERIFYDLKIFDDQKFDIDTISLNVLKLVTNSLKADLKDDDWSYCHSFVRWISENKGKFKFDKTIRYLNQQARFKNIKGYRFSILTKQYGLEEK